MHCELKSTNVVKSWLTVKGINTCSTVDKAENRNIELIQGEKAEHPALNYPYGANNLLSI